MWAFRALKRCIPLTAGVVALAFAAPAAKGTIPRLGRSIPAVGGDVGDVITTTCGNSPVIILAVIVCQAELPGHGATAPVLIAVRRGARPSVRPSPAPTSVAVSRQRQIEALADSTGWDWRRAGVVVHARFHPEACCHWGIYDFRDNSLWVGPSAFATSTRLRYTVLHELGHAWQWRTGRLDRLAADMAPWGHRGTMGGLEAGADCLSVIWGASPGSGHYWACPPAAAKVVARRLAGDWSS
jgi:hypothetical protein